MKRNRCVGVCAFVAAGVLTSSSWLTRDLYAQSAGSAMAGLPFEVDPAFVNIVHCVVLGNDGMVYVCDRNGDRIQVFDRLQAKYSCSDPVSAGLYRQRYRRLARLLARH